MLLMFLEDKDAQEQFILSQLTEYIAANMPKPTQTAQRACAPSKCLSAHSSSRMSPRC